MWQLLFIVCITKNQGPISLVAKSVKPKVSINTIVVMLKNTR